MPRPTAAAAGKLHRALVLPKFTTESACWRMVKFRSSTSFLPTSPLSGGDLTVSIREPLKNGWRCMKSLQGDRFCPVKTPRKKDQSS
ncbi:hypothetical protein R1flu_003789 [Riccia fluitans]|uniref:Uncharacterized protein n=1 Tax=Riccia fluitans TaxID=41844 RepID=A0ABD1YDM8_9MARC